MMLLADNVANHRQLLLLLPLQQQRLLQQLSDVSQAV
jgi:hypothetical protein